MAVKARNYKLGNYAPHTPAAAVTAGVPTQLVSGGRVGVPQSDVAAAATDDFQVRGHIRIEKVQLACNEGLPAYFDADGSPYGGTASSGCVTPIATDGDFLIGSFAEAAAATDTHAIVVLNVLSEHHPAWPNLTHETVDDDKTLDAEDVGKVLHIATDAKTFTLPATVVGYRYIIVNDGADGACIITVSPNTNDKIMGADLAGVDNKDRVNTKATANSGDHIILEGDGADGWFVVEELGTWAAEA